MIAAAICAQNPPGGYGPGSGGGVGNTASAAAPVMALYFSNQCPVSNTGQCYYTPANTQLANDCTWSSGAATVTCATSHFSASDVGKRVAGYFKTDSFGSIFGCVAGRISFSSMTTGTLTISSFTSGTSITLSGNPANTATSNNGCFIWGNPDDSTASTFETAYAAISSFCPKVMLAAAGYWFSSPHFSSQPAGCAALPSLFGASTSNGNMVFTAGFELEGRGPGNTVIYLGPDFPNGDTCARTQLNISNACFLIPTEGKWADLQISGGGQLACQVAANKILIGMTVATMQNVSLTNMCQVAAGGQIGIEADLLSQIYQVNNSGFGMVCLQTASGTGYIQAFKLGCENSPGNNAGTIGAVDVQAGSGTTPTFTCFGCLLLGAISSGNMAVVNVASTAVVRLIGTVLANCEAGSSCVNNTATQMVKNQGGTVYLNNVTMLAQGGAGPTNVTGLFNTVSPAKAYVEQTSFASASSGFSYADAAGTTLYDIGGNTGVYTTASANGAVVADGHSIRGICTGTATSSSTLGLFGTGPNETTTTCTSTTIGTGIPMTQGRSVAYLAVTATHAGVGASSGVVTVLKNGVATTSTCTIGTGTSCLDITHNPAFAAGDLLSLQFTTQATEVLAGVQAQVIWQ